MLGTIISGRLGDEFAVRSLCTTTQETTASTPTATESNEELEKVKSPNSSAEKPDALYEYEAPFWKPLKRVKLLSVSSLVATFTSVPVMLLMQSGTGFSGRIGAVMTVGFFSLFTTSMLHWFSSPYVCFLRHRKGSDQVEVETCSLLAQKKIRTFKLDQMELPDGSLRPLVTFEVEGTPFYIDEKHFSYQDVLDHIPVAEMENEQGTPGEGEAGQ